MIERLEKIAAAGIQIIPVEINTHFIFERDGFAALVERVNEGFGNIGSAGLVTEQGFAVLVWRDSKPFFVARGFDQQATDEQVDKLRSFAADLKQALA